MFNQFESSDGRRRDAVRDRRLMSLRCAYEAGYFDEEGSVPMPEIVADGGGLDSRPWMERHDPHGSPASPSALFDYDAMEAKALEQWRSHSEFLRGTTSGRMRKWGGNTDNCPTCGRPAVMFVDGDCPGCNPTEEQKAVDKICPLCAGFGTMDSDDVALPRKCRVCNGRGVIW